MVHNNSFIKESFLIFYIVMVPRFYEVRKRTVDDGEQLGEEESREDDEDEVEVSYCTIDSNLIMNAQFTKTCLQLCCC